MDATAASADQLASRGSASTATAAAAAAAAARLSAFRATLPTTTLPFPPVAHGHCHVSLRDLSSSLPLVKHLLRREEELRMCDAQQALFAAV